MARIRTIKPEFFTSEQIVECSTSARLAFVGLLCFSDDRGVHPASVKRFKMEVFPGDPITDEAIQALIDELIANGLIAEFQAENQCYWHVTGWKKHQRIDRPTYRYPDPEGQNSTSIRRVLDEASTSPRDGMESNGMESNGSNTCSELPKTETLEPVILTFPTTGKIKEWGLTQSKVNEYSETYPHLDVLAECRKARQWAIDTPAKRKTHGGMTRFLNSWLTRVQNSQGGQLANSSRSTVRPAEEELAERRQITGGRRI